MRTKYTLMQEAIALMGELLSAQAISISVSNQTRRKFVCEPLAQPNSSYVIRLHPQFGDWSKPPYLECEAGTKSTLPFQFKEDFNRPISIPEGFLTAVGNTRTSLVDSIQQRLAVVSTFSGISMSIDNLTGIDILVRIHKTSNDCYEIQVTTEDQVSTEVDTYKKMGNERINFAIALQV